MFVYGVALYHVFAFSQAFSLEYFIKNFIFNKKDDKPFLLIDYERMKASECLTQELTPFLRKHYSIDRVLYYIGRFIVNLVK